MLDRKNQPFNSEAPSSLSPDRIIEINHLCLKEYSQEQLLLEDPIDFNDLMIATLGLKEVLESIIETDSNIHFYRNIDKAFNLLLDCKPDDRSKTFRTYQDLTSTFRVINKQSEIIYNKIHDLNILLHDLDVLQDESFNHNKGGASC